jgi:hypothetical protein
MKPLAIAGITLAALLGILAAISPFLSTSTDCGPNTRVPSNVKSLILAIKMYHLDKIQNKETFPTYPKKLQDLTKDGYLSESELKGILSKETNFKYFAPPSDDVPPLYPLIAAENSKFIVYGFVSGEIQIKKKPIQAQQDAAANP